MSAAVCERSARAGDDLAANAIMWGARERTPKPVALTGRDLRLMALLRDVNYLSASQLTLLGWGRESKAASRRLWLLHAAGYLDKFRAHNRIGSNEWNYRVTHQGWQALADRGLIGEERYTPSELHSISYAEHDLQLNGLVIHIAQATAPPGDTGLIERMPFVWLGPRTGRIEPGTSSGLGVGSGLPPDVRLHHEQSRLGYLEPDATLIGGMEGDRFAVLVEYDRTRRPHKQLDRLRRYDHWLLHGWAGTRFAEHAIPPAVLLLADRDRALSGLVGVADRALTAWHGPPHATAAEGTHPARQRIVLTSRKRVLQGDWVMRRPPNLPPSVRNQTNLSPRGIGYDLSTLLAQR